MRIALIVEGKTEKVFIPHLRSFLHRELEGRMPALDPFPYDGRIPKEDKLRRIVNSLFRQRADHVIALTDVYTGIKPPEFIDATDAKHKMRQWVPNEPRFHPHAAQYDFEAWLLPYWPAIQRLAGHNRSAPKGVPESVNHDNPPAHRIQQLFAAGHCRQHYSKPRDAGRILRESDLSVAIGQCPELKSLVNTILVLSGGMKIP
ncbi:MAG: DUF4276 family protein [Magnetococcales bacterium]|nr:DUF4276 family protein [Magnetococcales bacterium]MBF0150978.1 DUF4276 family protein [Magnetococcales bacterium]MBF0629912.1 DUF4276 family protein [Magnetococcales bacterium]